MNLEGKNILIRFKKRWQFLLLAEVVLYALGSAVLIYLISLNPILSGLGFVLIGLISTFFIKPWRPDLDSASTYIDRELDTAEYSSSLFYLSDANLSDLAKLQQIKISKKLSEHIKGITPPNHVLRAGISASFLVLIGLLIAQFDLIESFRSTPNQNHQNELINFQNNDSTQIETNTPVLIVQEATIRYPKYTNIRTLKTSEMDIKALEGSSIQWQLKFDSEVDSVTMKSMGNNYPMKFNNGSYTRNSKLTNSGFYNFEFTDPRGNSYSSDLYGIDVVKDASPNIEIQGLDQFTTFTFSEEKILNFKTVITDDYGIADAYIIATVSKGSGESVKFREEKLSFDNPIKRGNKKLALNKRIDLDKMNMEPGDELYFYIETSDLKQPRSNTSRSETLFAVIKDTTFYEFGIEGTLGVDQMPDYFRSQRQLIIDTKKLISERSIREKKEFNFISNELGFDQKALRLKYAEFMGEENESGLAIETETDATAEEESIDDENTDPLADYTHDHDSENEHNLVDTNTKNDPQKSTNPLQEFIHDHEDPEMVTLFEESLKVKLHKALNEMWDAELYLRLYEPEKSLPYQYNALKLIQEIKNSARIYVHRIGFDPPPIKEDKRLTGKLEEVSSYYKNEELIQENLYPFMRRAVKRLDELIVMKGSLSENDLQLFEQAGNELAIKAIETPGKYLKILQQLKQIADGKENSLAAFKEVQKGLFLAIPKQQSNPARFKLFSDEIDQLLLKELNIND